MATTRGSSSSYDIGNKPPTVLWTVVRGDTSGFRVYATDDAKVALNIPDWDISMKIKRPNSVANLGVITDDATTVMILTPAPDANDGPGEFTVWLEAAQSQNLQTGDIFDIQLTDPSRVWTVAQGSMKILEDVTD
jgi:myosin-crossreactive antigen